MNDRELLELAAKAAGMDGAKYDSWPGMDIRYGFGYAMFHDSTGYWNPLIDDGDALRLAVKLGIQVTPYPIYSEPKHSVLARKCRIGKEDNGIGEPETGSIEWIELYGDDPEAATRLAIVRAAAEIGKGMDAR